MKKQVNTAGTNLVTTHFHHHHLSRFEGSYGLLVKVEVSKQSSCCLIARPPPYPVSL